MDVDALHILAVLAKELPGGKTIVEAGGLFGCSATNFALNTPKTTKIYTIDPWQHEVWIEQFTDQKLSRSAFVDFLRRNDVVDRVEPIQGYAPEAWGGEKVDLFFEDATHSQPVVRKNLIYFDNLLNEGGILCGDDFGPTKFPAVVYEVSKLTVDKGKHVSTFGGNVWATSEFANIQTKENIFPMTMTLRNTLYKNVVPSFGFGLERNNITDIYDPQYIQLDSWEDFSWKTLKFDFLDGNKAVISEMRLGETVEIIAKKIKGVRVWGQSELLETHNVYFQALFRGPGLQMASSYLAMNQQIIFPGLDDRNLIGLRVLAVKR